ncbi:MAG TPA: cytochrome c biogenesis protein CcdA [Candidatus Methanoperedens sp.]|nr:cytochrome c biogenesis protein CcdA [Candidatus Methanoperedens sp.]
MSGSISFGAAFLGGLLSFFSPCVLPLMPGYLCYISGLSFEELERLPPGAHLGRTLRHAAVFAAGFTAVFVALGLTATSLGAFLGGHAVLLRRVAGGLIFVFGLQVSGILRLGFLHRERRFEVHHHAVGPARSLLLGMAFAFGWTPCIGPILFSVLSYAAGTGAAATGALLLLCYSLGLALPFLLAAAATSWSFRLIGRSGRWLRPVQVAAGIVMMAMGIALITGAFERLNTLLARVLA